MMKRNYLLFFILSSILLIALSFSTQAQEVTSPNPALKVWKQVLGSHARYPLSDLRARKTGFVSVDIELDQEGKISSYEITESKTEAMKESVEAALEKAIPLWQPDMLPEEERKDSYEIYFSFEMVDPQNPNAEIEAVTRQIYKGKPEKALKMTERLVDEKPFEPKYLELRSQIHRKLQHEAEATADLMESQRLQQNTLAKIEIKSFTIVQTRSISGTINR
ncbi:TonB family protein [Algoriphagus formosus]|uniref:TonB family protein n=1 Tax=Algoriphagus formosus TaxID=2007308 RepID=UPI003F71D751